MYLVESIAMAPALPLTLDSNPFAVLSLIVAPAILTNATSVLIMSTSTRLARAIDLSRELSRDLEEVTTFTGAKQQRKLRELAAAIRRIAAHGEEQIALGAARRVP